MTTPSDEIACRRVLSSFNAASPDSESLWMAAKSRWAEKAAPRLTEIQSGLSGARVWRVHHGVSGWALRQWSRGAVSIDRLGELHRWIGWLVDVGRLPLAKPFVTKNGVTWLEHRGSLWQLEPWLDGEPELRVPADSQRVSTAVTALAQLHLESARSCSTASSRTWFSTKEGPAPAVLERIPLLANWTPSRLAAAYKQLQRLDDPVIRNALQEIVATAGRMVPRVREQMLQARSVKVPLLPCLRDARPDHFLFSQHQLAGIIDPSAARTETVAADLSRLLGGYLPAGPATWSAALDDYEKHRLLTFAERQLLPVLDASNAVLSSLHWVDVCLPGAMARLSPEQGRRVLELAERLMQLSIE
ncbi:MAG: phosphotransferase [Planctomycetaceae bacterium]